MSNVGEVRPDTGIPSYFTWNFGGLKVAVLPDVTEHIQELAPSIGTGGIPFAGPGMAEDLVLESLFRATSEAIENGITFGTEYNYGGWEFGGPRTLEGVDAVLYHGVPKGIK